MNREYHHWYSHRLNREMGVVVYGHWGPPIIGFPTSGGDEWELEGQSMIGALADFIDAGRVKIFTVNSINQESFYNRGAHPAHRAWVQKQFDDYLANDVFPFIHDHCRGWTPITTMGASMGAYHAANTLLKHPDVVKRCFAMSGVFDMKTFMDGYYDDNFYFNNPVDYLSNLSDAWHLDNLRTCDIHLVTGHGPFEHSGPSYHLADILRTKGIPASVDDWGPMGGHDWPYWKNQMREYLGRLY
jgi:esterase/lipase superfamily enzyme